ncbi:AbrB/MazE/SpoVT family DNA-binding domain-containing protein [Segnochrobactrum spirostomi]|nr:AbrB/MazE/SpoVT family DNA-binding domain-containing protein [Segnochrobactrum spirostomi]
MTEIKIDRWGRGLAITLPEDVAREFGLAAGQILEIESREGELLLRRAGRASDAGNTTVADEILQAARGRRLGGVALRDLIGDGRRT